MKDNLVNKSGDLVNDTISREAALAEVMCLCEDCPVELYMGPCPSQQCDVRIMQEALENLPSAQPDIPGINVIIDTIKNAISASTGNDAYMVGLRNRMRWCLSALIDKEQEYEDMPSAQPGWIPISEKLPKDDTEVIVSCTDDSGDYEYSYVTTGWHYKGLWVVNNDRCYFVKAWQPLPAKPWEGGQE